MRQLCVLCMAFLLGGVLSDLTVDDLDLFDVVEEVKENFYEFLDVARNATTSDIRKAYRRLSLQFHPDKNPDPDAPEKFRKIAAVVEVLKDERKRAKYHEVLEYGIPDWARSMYYRYYRKARKMGSTEMTVLMAIIVTVAQTLWMYTSYWEKKFNIDSVVNEAIKRKQQKTTNNKRKKAAEEEIRNVREQLMSNIVAPAFKDIWFISIPISIFNSMRAVSILVKEQFQQAEQSAESGSDVEEEKLVRPKRTPRQRIEVKGAQIVNGNASVVTTTVAVKNAQSDKKSLKTGPWTSDEVAALIRLLKRFPVGTNDRWDKISCALNRSTTDVTEKTKHLRTMNTTVIPQQQSSSSSSGGGGSISKNSNSSSSSRSMWVESEISTRSSEEEDDEDDRNHDRDDDDPTAWSISQQKQLESAMVAYPRWTEGRWDLIADRVEGKSKRACKSRVKWLIENIKKKKTEASD